MNMARHQPFRLILGSQSATRKAILEAMGLTFQVIPADIDEKAIRHEDPTQLVLALGLAKAEALLQRVREIEWGQRDGKVATAPDQTYGQVQTLTQPQTRVPPTFLLTADQVVVLHGQILEKPSSVSEARQFLHLYGDPVSSPARTIGSVVITDVSTGQMWSAVDSTEIYFRKLDQQVIDQLIEQGEVFYCAGGLRIEDPLVSRFIDCIIGETESVLGLSPSKTKMLLEKAYGGPW